MQYIALLRGINVGGHAKLPMVQLREIMAALRYTDVTTYIQSGNVIFTCTRTDPERVQSEIEQEISRQTSLAVTVVVRTRDELAAVIAANPFPGIVETPTRLHVVFLSTQPDRARLDGFDPSPYAPDELEVGNRVLYVHYPGGAGSSKLTNDVLEKRLGVRGTARNWNTVTKLLALSSS